MLFSDDILARAAAGDPATLAALDARGLLAGPGEALADYAARLRQLAARLSQLEADLATTGRFRLEDVEVRADARIDPALYAEAGDVTERLFGFRIDWVPGFYIDPRCAWLFGGCAYSFFPEFFVLFIIRKAFATRDRWFLYTRRELLAHELTHVSRFALYHEQFEERIAYLTSESAFRRSTGGLFRVPRDSFLLLGSTMLLLLAQVLQLTALPWLPVPLFWAGVGGVCLWLGLRHAHAGRLFRRARAALAGPFGDRATAVLCRCSRDDIRALAGLATPAAVHAWLTERARTEWRWELIRARFAAGAPVAPVLDHAPAGC